MTHPTHEQLFDAAAERDLGALASHVNTCDACRTAYQRLLAGAALLDEGRISVPDIDWSRIEAAVHAEGERVAADIRAGRLRAPRPWGAYAVGAAALAAAAVGVIQVRAHRTETPSVAHGVHAPHTAPETTPTPDPGVAFEGAVLLAAGGATQTPVSGAAVSLAGGAALREGARVTTTSGGRAVFTVRPRVAVDVRADSEVALTTLRTSTVTLALAAGELAVDRDGDDGQVSVRAGRWTVSVEGDATVRAERSLVRVVVLAGRATAEAEGATRVTYTGPIVLELPDAGEAHTLTAEATDAARLDLALLRPEGTIWSLPPIDPTAVVTMPGHGALPTSLEALRVAAPVTLQARVGRALLTLEVGTGRALAWRTQTTVASAQAPATRPSPQHAVATPATPQAAEPDGRALQPAEIRAMSQRIAPRFSHCFSTLRERNQCPQEMRGAVELSIAPDGSASIASLDPSATCARTCLSHELQFVRFPATGGTSRFSIGIGR